MATNEQVANLAIHLAGVVVWAVLKDKESDDKCENPGDAYQRVVDQGKMMWNEIKAGERKVENDIF